MIVGNLLTIAIVLRLHETSRKPGGRFLPLLLRECEFPLFAIEPLGRYCYSMLLCERQTDRDMLLCPFQITLHEVIFDSIIMPYYLLKAIFSFTSKEELLFTFITWNGKNTLFLMDR